MKKIVIILLCVLGAVQNTLADNFTFFKQDFLVFKEVLLSSHPNLYQYRTKQEIDSVLKITENKLYSLESKKKYYQILQDIVHFIQDGHTQIFLPIEELMPNGEQTPQFPILIKILEKSVIVDYSYKNIPIGSKILSINNHSVQDIIKRLEKYVVVDGVNHVNRKVRYLERKFQFYYFLEYGVSSKFKVELQLPNQEMKELTLKAKPLCWIKTKQKYRASLFINTYTKSKNKIRVLGKKPSVVFVDSLSTALLTINTFNRDLNDFKKEIDQIFQEISVKQTKSLVIDLRRNRGGYRMASIYLFSYLTLDKFKQRLKTELKTLILPHKKHLIKTGYNEQIVSEFVSKEKMCFDDMLEEKMLPHKQAFKGKIYVLVSGETFSAAASFSALAYNQDNIIVIGEETSGGYYHYSSDFFVIYKLPKTGIFFSFFMSGVTAHVNKKHKKHGSGVKPHYQIEISVQDLICQKDGQLLFVFQKINENLHKVVKFEKEIVLNTYE